MEDLPLIGLAIVLLLGLVGLTLGLAMRIARKNRALAVGLVALLLMAVIYNVYDNNRIVVKQEMVSIPGLPAAFEGFAILQISDLHGKSFGPDQARLTNLINGLDYDMIAFTGDMETGAGSFAPFLALLDGLADRENMFYVNGNEDLAFNLLSGVKSETGKMLEAQGCRLLTHPFPLRREGATLWLGNDLSKAYRGLNVYAGMPKFYFASAAQYQAYLQHFAEVEAMAAPIRNNQDIKIALSHIPYLRTDLEQGEKRTNILDYDLILAGHYHGGQIRVPGYGAVFIPVWASHGNPFFPEQKYVSGLVENQPTQQYISRGLGASNVPFRLFKTPEINLIILRAR